jgi:nicotinate-nucleotide pyrophosphorylase (carboxylating)
LLLPLTSGSITEAIKTLRRAAGFSLLVTIECQSEAEADEAIAAGANIVMLDNLTGEALHGAARSLKQRWKAQGREFLIETSGGIIEGQGMKERLGPDIDILSTSAVHQVGCYMSC